jgi:hypothetical protein
MVGALGRVLVAAALASASIAGAGEELPKGWRLPSQAELSDRERAGSPERLARAVGDFNGDGVHDEALLLKSEAFSGEGLWVRLSGSQGTRQWLSLDKINWGPSYPNVSLAMAIEVAPPGIHAYGCFDGVKDCNFGPQEKRPKLKLRDPAIVYYKPESAGSMYFWSRKHNRFMRVWLSD